MTTKRTIKNDVEQLKDANGDGSSAVIMESTHFDHDGAWPDMEDSPHPELTVQPHPEQKPKSLQIAVPNLIPEKYLQGRILSIKTCDNSSKHDSTDNDSGTVFACELWDELSDDDLEREKEIREEKGQQLPAVLEDL